MTQNEMIKNYSYKQLAVIFSSLSKGAEKQYYNEESKIFLELSEYFYKNTRISNQKEDPIVLLNDDLEKEFVNSKLIANFNKDRGALRALTWAEKVTNVQQSLIKRFLKEGPEILNGNKIFVCEICGFIFIGKEVPEVCPICKVPSLKIHEVK